MVVKSYVLTASIVLSAFCLAPMAALAADVSPTEYALFMDWKNGQEDEKLAEDDQETKTKKIAKSLGVTVAELEAAIAKVQAVESTLGTSTAEAALATSKRSHINARRRQ